MKTILCRYEYQTRGGKKFTDWFDYYVAKDDEGLSEKELLKKAANEVKALDKATKLKHEFKIPTKE